MKLSELNPEWWAQPGRTGQGVVFDCRAGRARVAVAFSNPIDGGAPFPINNMKELWAALRWNVGDTAHPPVIPPGFLWQRSGDTFETLTLAPSVDASRSGHWHGWVTGGQIT